MLKKIFFKYNSKTKLVLIFFIACHIDSDKDVNIQLSR